MRNSKVCRILIHPVGYNDDGEAAPDVPVFENCSFENMQITAKFRNKDGNDEFCEAIELSGFDVSKNYIRNIMFKNIKIDNGTCSRKQKIYLQYCEGISFENISCC